MPLDGKSLIQLLGLFLTVRVTLSGRTPALHVGVGMRKRIPLGEKKNGTRKTIKH